MTVKYYHDLLGAFLVGVSVTLHANAFAGFRAPHFDSRTNCQLESASSHAQRLCLKSPSFFMIPHTAQRILRINLSDGEVKEEGTNADGIDESNIGNQAFQALEFWRHRQPSPDLPPGQVVGLLMAALQKNDEPAPNEGLRTVYAFSSAMCRRAVGGTEERFISQARQSVFGATLGCRTFSLDPFRTVGDHLATQVVSVTSADGRSRRFLWTLELQRRPPDMGKWLIYGVVSSDVDGKLTMTEG